MYKIIKYVISGGSGALVDISILYFFVKFLHVWYIFSAIFAYIVAFIVSFTLQKVWTFSDYSISGTYKQAGKYLVISFINLGLNTFFMYLFVDIFGIHYIIGQIVSGCLLAIYSFSIYSSFIFSSNLSK